MDTITDAHLAGLPLADDEAGPETRGGRAKDPLKRAAIVEAAQRLFIEGHGPGSVSMDAIAKAAGVSKATLYSHFDDKDALFAACIRAKCDTFLGPASAPPDRDASAEDQLHAIGSAFLELICDPEANGVFFACAEAAQRTGDVSHSTVFYDNAVLPTVERIRDTIAALAADGRLSIPPDEIEPATWDFVSLVKGRAHFRLQLGLDPGPGAEIDAHVRRCARRFAEMFRPRAD